ncbi:unnamed protein product [Allacma fusca]|uniref:Uncharacterized protein n=1 Tax=Allacma fusca TaxID=39272 RepID=A0A8J2JMZ2_9HEXA|nr:unnamed protein product [Allacma fusca]
MDLTYLERFELQVAQELIKATLAHGKLNESPEIRRMVEEYLRDFLTGNGFRKMKDILSIQETLASKNPICTYRLIRRHWLS